MTRETEPELSIINLSEACNEAQVMEVEIPVENKSTIKFIDITPLQRNTIKPNVIIENPITVEATTVANITQPPASETADLSIEAVGRVLQPLRLPEAVPLPVKSAEIKSEHHLYRSDTSLKERNRSVIKTSEMPSLKDSTVLHDKVEKINGQEYITIQIKQETDEVGTSDYKKQVMEKDMWYDANLVGLQIEDGITLEKLSHVKWDTVNKKSVYDATDVEKKYHDVDEIELDPDYHAMMRDKPSGCPACKRQFTRRNYLYWHMVKGSCIDTAKNPSFGLVVCASFLRWIRTIEQFVTDKLCPHCQFTFSNYQATRVHFMSDNCQRYDANHHHTHYTQDPITLQFKCKHCIYKGANFFYVFQHVLCNHLKVNSENIIQI